MEGERSTTNERQAFFGQGPGGGGAARVWDRESWLKLEKAKGGLEVPSGQFPVCEAAGAWEGGVTSSPDPLTGRPFSVTNISLTKSLS